MNTRRTILGALAAPLVASAAPRFLSAAEFATLDDLSEIIIPTDEHSAGGKQAACAAFIDSLLAQESEDRRARWRTGLDPFLPLSNVDRTTRLEQLAKSDDPFFTELKRSVAHAYYTSRIGIQQEMEYKGNTVQQEYSGIDVA